MTPAERSLLLAVFRWARAEGGLVYGLPTRWSCGGPIDQRWGVSWSWDFERERLTVWRGRITARDYWVLSIAEAVDVLVALGILPPRFSTAYRAGWGAMRCYSERAHYGAEWLAIRPVVRHDQVEAVCRHAT